jgi:LPXTG-motif cell wall-anchored protein
LSNNSDEDFMKKFALSIAAFIAAAPLVFASGAAFASTTYAPALVKQFNTENDYSFSVEYIVPVNDSVAVVVLDNGDLWRTDGTPAGTTALAARAASDGLDDWLFDQYSWSNRAVADGAGTLYFWGNEVGVNEWNVWTYDGTSFEQLTTVGFTHLSSLYWLNNEIYAWGKDTNSSVLWGSLYQIDPSTGAYFEIAGGNNWDEEYQDNSSQVSFTNGRIIFMNDVANNGDNDLVSWNPASPGTPVVSLNDAANAADDFAAWDSRGVFGGEVYFGGHHDTLGQELWATDGTVAGTRFVKDINTGSGDSEPGTIDGMWFTEFAGELYFAAGDGDDWVLYKTDGTTEGTVRAVDGLRGPGNCIEAPGLVVGESLYTNFSCDEFYILDGTTATRLTDDSGGLCWDSCVRPVNFDSRVFFVYHDGTNNSVWVTDGTTAGTSEVTNFADDGALGNQDFDLVRVGSHLMFGVRDETVDGGTGEMALYSIEASGLADTGTNVDGLAVAALVAAVAGAGVYAVRRRRAVV